MLSVGRHLKLDDVLHDILENIVRSFDDVVGVEVYLLDEEKITLFLKTQRGLSPQLIGTGTLETGEGLAGQVVSTEKPLYIEDLSTDPCFSPQLAKKEKISTYAGVPLIKNRTVLGTLGIYTRKPKRFSDEEKKLFESLGRALSLNVHNALMYEQAAQRTKRFTTISRAITVTRQLGTLEEVLQDISKVLVQSLGFDKSWIGLVDTENTTLLGKAGCGIKNGIATSTVMKSGSSNPAVTAVVEKKPVVFPFVEDVPEGNFKAWLEALDVQSFAYVPILGDDQAVGVIGVFYGSDQSFQDEDIKTLNSVAEQAAIAIENARLYEQIKTSEERYRTLFESAGTSLVILDAKHRFRLVNHAFETLSGLPRDELIGQTPFTGFLSGKSDTDHLKHPPNNWETRFTNREGKHKQVHITTTRIPESDDLLVSLSDMTQQRELERRLFRSEELAAIGELSAGIAHEIRNPLVALTTSVSLLKDEPDISAENQELFDVMREESDHLAAIVDDFLRFARPKKPVFQETDLNKLLNDVVRRYREYEEKEVRWIQKYGPSLPTVMIDRHQIQQVISNLVLNSLQAIADGGEICLDVVFEKRHGEDRVCIEVKDSGCGIPEEEVAKIFQPFYSTKMKGTGMGLAICQRIVNEHGGDILVQSEKDKGTTFTIAIPIQECTPDDQA